MLSQDPERRVDVSGLLLESLENVDHRYSEDLYDGLVPTLGGCVADAVYGCLRSFGGYPWILKRITECLSIVGNERIEEFARPLIESDDRNQQRRGVNLLRLVACPALLDQLWAIHIEGQADPTAFGEDEKKNWLLYKETFDALKRAVNEAPDWIHRAIEQADPNVDTVCDLGYLVANLEDGGTTWNAVKSLLFEKMPANKPRSLVANIAKYRDLSEVEWLQRWIGSEVDQVASPALQALSRLDPDAAVEALPRMDPFDLQTSRLWSFAEVFERRPAATRAKMLELMRATNDPRKIALVFRNRENDISTEQIDIILDSLVSTLGAKLRGDGDRRRGVHLELAFLAQLAAPEHLNVLHARRGTAFETTLRDYVLNIGPQLGVYSTGIERDPAMVILNLIGGEGLTAVTNEFLVSGDQYGKHDAMKWASKRPDATTIDRLREIIRSDECWPGVGDSPYPVNQNRAMEVLAQHGYWQSVAKGLQKWGMRTSSDLKNCPEPVVELWVDSLRQAIQSTPTPGNILALGMVGCVEDCSRIHAILDQCETDSELAHACIIALKDLGDRSDTGVAKVSQHLSIKKQRYSAVGMLQNAGTPQAWAALFEDLKEHFDFVVALNLINLSEYHDTVAEIALSHIPTYQGIDGHSLLRLFLTKIRQKEVRDRILCDTRVRELFHQASADAEGRFWFTGSKANAIECMAEFAPDAAFAAACHVLGDADAHDRERFPSILMSIDRDRGIEWLVDHYSREESQLVRVAIGRALEDAISVPTVLDRMHTEAEEARIAAVELTGWAMLDNSIDVALDQVLDDRSEEVIRAAIAARQRRRDRRTVVALTRLVVEETDPVERSVYFDALIGFVDPGDDHRPLPPTLRQALQAVSDFEAKDALDRLKKRREKLHDELEKAKS